MASQQIPVNGRADGSGNASVQFPSFARGITRTITQITVSNSSAATNITQLASIFLNNVLDCATRSNPDTAAGAITLRSADSLTVIWTGLDANATVTATFIYDDKQAM